jgi:xylulokinase
MLRAVVEGLACEVARHLRLLTDAGLPVARLMMCGSAAASRQTPQIVADIIQCPVLCIDAFDVSALGAAALAGGLLEPDVPLKDIVERMAPASRLVTPGPNTGIYQKVREEYLKLFDQQPMGA